MGTKHHGVSSYRYNIQYNMTIVNKKMMNGDVFMAFRDDYQLFNQAIDEGVLPETKKFMTLVKKAEQEPSEKLVKSLQDEYLKLEKKWRKEHDDETYELYLTTLWRKIGLIEQELNQQLNEKRTKWDIFREMARSNEWVEVVKLIDEFEKIDDNNYRKIEPDYFQSLEDPKKIKGFTELIALNHFTIKDKEVSKEQKDQLLKIFNKIVDEEWKTEEAWSKGSELLQLVSSFKKTLTKK